MSLWAFLFNLGITILCTLFFFMASCTKPGYLKNDKVTFLEMLKNIDSTQLCADCELIRTSRSRHCPVCGHCIERFDHHCPWINNCVGVRNHNAFYLYILTQGILVITAFSQGCTALIRFILRDFPDDDDSLFSHSSDSLFTKDAFVLPFLIYLIGVTAFFIVPLILLVFY